MDRLTRSSKGTKPSFTILSDDNDTRSISKDVVRQVSAPKRAKRKKSAHDDENLVDKENLVVKGTNIVDNNEKNLGTVVKKFKMTNDELQMSGAPEGDLYDIKVLSPEELSPLELDNTMVLENLQSYLAAITLESSSWADRFACVEFIRRMLLTTSQRQVLREDYVLLIASLEACYSAIGSLRSCIVRNGLFALDAMIDNIPTICDMEHIKPILHTTLNGKILASGPRFIRDLGTRLLQNLFSKETFQPHSEVINELIEYTMNKNPEVSALAYNLSAACALQTFKYYYKREPSGPQNNEHLNLCTQVLYKALNAKKPIGREKSREAFQCMFSLWGESKAQDILSQALSTHEVSTVNREMTSMTSSNSFDKVKAATFNGFSGKEMMSTHNKHEDHQPSVRDDKKAFGRTTGSSSIREHMKKARQDTHRMKGEEKSSDGIFIFQDF